MHFNALYGKVTCSSLFSILLSWLFYSEVFAPDFDQDAVPAWQFLPSPRNITIERGWRVLMDKWGTNILYYYNSGRYDGFYHPNNELHQ